MIDLQSDEALYYWTFDSLDDLRLKGADREFAGRVWKCDRIPAKPAVSGLSIAFDPPEEWNQDPGTSYRFNRNEYGLYVCNGDGFVYEAARSDTPTNAILTGTWKERDYGSGVFIAVIPKEDAG